MLFYVWLSILFCEIACVVKNLPTLCVKNPPNPCGAKNPPNFYCEKSSKSPREKSAKLWRKNLGTSVSTQLSSSECLFEFIAFCNFNHQIIIPFVFRFG